MRSTSEAPPLSYIEYQEPTGQLTDYPKTPPANVTDKLINPKSRRLHRTHRLGQVFAAHWTGNQQNPLPWFGLWLQTSILQILLPLPRDGASFRMSIQFGYMRFGLTRNLTL